MIESNYLSSIITVASIYLLAVISPGPDVAITIRNSLLYSRKYAVFGALGTSTGVFLHFTYTVLGISYLISSVPWSMHLIQAVGAVYLCYIGYKSFTENNFEVDLNKNNKKIKRSLFKAFKSGFLISALNPMVILLFIGILSGYMSSETSTYVKFSYGAVIFTIALSWFTFVAIFFSHKKSKRLFITIFYSL